jgi:hypothetical protein
LYFLAEGETSFGVDLPPPPNTEERVGGSGLTLGMSTSVSSTNETEEPMEQQADVVSIRTACVMHGIFRSPHFLDIY